MQKLLFSGILAVLATLLLPARAEPAGESGALQAAAKHGPVFVLPIHGVIDKALMFTFRRAFRQVEKLQPQAIIIELETPGGGLRETEEIIAWMRSVNVPIYAFVNTHAQSAGAIIALATTRIYMAPGSRIGSALPIMINPLGGGVVELTGDVKEKILSDTRSLVRGLAQERGHWEEVAMAMVDPARGLKVGEQVICAPGQLLNLTAKEAIEIIPPRTEPLLAAGIVPDLTTLLDQLSLKNATVIRFEETAAERLARVITLWGPLLLALGILGIYIEFKMPGTALPGVLGGALLVLYFFGHYVAGLAGMEDIVLVAIGFVLLGIEVFVLPGFGVVGIAGILCIMAGIIMGLIPLIPSGPPGLPEMPLIHAVDYLQEALFRVLATFAIGGVGVWLLARFLPRTSLYGNLVLKTTLSPAAGYLSHTAEKYDGLVGQTGIALTFMRPAGTAEIGGRRLDVVSSGDLIPKDANVRIIQVEGSRIVVEQIPPEQAG